MSAKPNRREQRAQAQQFISSLQGTAFPNSKRIWIAGSRPDIRVPMREIQLSPTLIGGDKNDPIYEANEPVPVYDTAGPYGDPEAQIDVHQGLPRLRSAWIEQRGDSELTQLSSSYSQQRLKDEGLDHLRFDNLPRPRRAMAGRRVTQLHYARQGSRDAGDGVYRPARKHGP